MFLRINTEGNWQEAERRELIKEQRYMNIDLHIHTCFSDGMFTPNEVVDFAKDARLRAIAIADHDTIDGLEEGREKAEEKGIEFIEAVELTSFLNGKELHILGYFINRRDKGLNNGLGRAKERNLARVNKMIDNLNREGISVSYNEIDNSYVTRTHLVEKILEKGYVESFKEGYEKYLGVNGSCYVEPDNFTPKEAIELINDAGGLSFLAHPDGFDVSPTPISEGEIQELKQSGLHGLEVYSFFHSVKDVRLYKGIAKKLGLLISGGSDFHGITKDVKIGRVKVPYQVLENMKGYWVLKQTI